MNKRGQLRLRLFPPPDAAVLPAVVVEEVLKQVAELLLKVQTAEDAKALPGENAREVADERQP